MRPLRQCYSTTREPAEPGPVEPLAVLASVGRPEPAFDEQSEFDRAFFGLEADEAVALGPDVPHLVEVVYEALELSGVRFARLGAMRAAWVHAGDERLALGTAARLLGLEGSTVALSGSGDALLCLALHHAAQVLRAGDVDLAVVSSRWASGFGAILLGRTDRAAAEQWRVRSLVCGSATGAEPERVQREANLRAGLASDVARPAPSPGTQGLLEAIAWIQEEKVDGGFTVDGRVDGQDVRVVLGVPEPSTVSESSVAFLGLSARSLPSLAGAVRAALGVLGTDEDLTRLAADAAVRPAFEHRLAVPAIAAAEVRSRLEQWIGGIPGTVAAGLADEPGLVFVLPPAGVQRVGMGDRLYATEPTFRDALHRCDRASRGLLPRALLSVLYPGHDRDPDAINDPLFANPITFALAWSLAELHRSRGLEPVAVLGGGVGELCAAAIAGSIDFEQGLRLAVERGRLLATLQVSSAWAVLGASEHQARELLLGEDEVDVVALPAPGRVVIGGTPEGVRRALERARRAGLQIGTMAGGPVHSPLVDGLLPDYAEAARTLEFRPTDLPVISTVIARRLTTAGPEHWVATLRAPLRLAAAFEAAWEAGGRTFLELSPRPTLLGVGRETLQHQPARWLAALDPATDDHRQWVENLAALWARGAPVEHGAVGRPPGGPSLPTYAFDRRPLADEWRVPTMNEAGLLEDTTASGPTSGSGSPDAGSDGGGGGWLAPLGLEPEITLVPAEELELLAPRVSALPAAVANGAPAPAATLDEEISVVEPFVPSPTPAPASLGDQLSAGTATAALEDETVWEQVSTAPDLLDLERAMAATPAAGELHARGAGPEALRPMPVLPSEEEVAMSVDSEPMAELTLDDPSLPRTFTPPPRPEPRPDDPTSDLLGQSGPVWRVGWRAEDLPAESAPAEPSTFVMLVDRRGIGDYLGTLLEQAGHRVIRAEVSPGVEHAGTLRVPDPSAEDAWIEILDAIGTVQGPVHVLHLWTLDDEETLNPAMGWPAAVALCQEILAQGLPAWIHLVTRGATGGGAVHPVIGAGLWGAAGLLFAETGLFAGIVDVDPDDEDPELLARHLLDVMGSGEPPGWWRLRGGRRFLRTVAPASPPTEAPVVDTEGTWLVVGDIDAVALELANWLVARGVKRMYLVTAGGAPPDVLKAVLEFQKQGTAVIVVRADPADARGVEQIRQRLGREKRLAGAFLRFAPTPRTLRDLVPRDDLPRWLTGLASARLVAELLPPGAPLWAWCEGSALDSAPGGGVGALIAASVDAALSDRPGAAVLHTAPHTTIGLARMLELVTGLATLGGSWGVRVR